MHRPIVHRKEFFSGEKIFLQKSEFLEGGRRKDFEIHVILRGGNTCEIWIEYEK
jgi:hypothetical protein